MILEPIERLKLGQVACFQKCLFFWYQEVKGQFWSILGQVLPEMGINEKPFVETT